MTMPSLEAESTLYGLSKGRSIQHLRFASGLFAIVSLVGWGVNQLFEYSFKSWPLRNGTNPRLVLGTIEIPATDILQWFLFGLIACGLVVSLLSAYRNRSLLASLALGLAPILGYLTGEIVYYGTWDILSPLFVGSAIGTFIGLLGFLLGIGLRITSHRFIGR